MKKLLFLLFLVGIGFSSFAQAPNYFNYQAVLRDDNGVIIQNQNVSLRISIHERLSVGVMVYEEDHAVKTNGAGLVNLHIGNGTNKTGVLGSIDWGKDVYVIKVQLDPTGGSSYKVMGFAQLVSVPYALYAANVNNSDTSANNELQVLSMSTDTLFLSNGGGYVKLPSGSGGVNNDNDSTNEIQTITLNANNVTLSNGGGIINLASYLDNTDAQMISLANDTLYLSNGGKVFLGSYNTPNTDNQTLSISGSTLSIAGGNSVNLPAGGGPNNDNDSTNELITSFSNTSNLLSIVDAGGTKSVSLAAYLDNTDSQTLTISGNTISISGGNSITLPSGSGPNNDNDSTNEIQMLSISGNTLTISKGNSITIPAGGAPNYDNDSTNEFQNLSISGSTLTISDGNSITLPAGGGPNNDNDSTNEIQTLSLVSDTVFISNSNYIVLPSGTINTDDQKLTLANDTLYLEDGGYALLSSYKDNTDNQALSLSNDTLYLTNGGFVKLASGSVNNDNDSTNEIQNLTISSDTIYISKGNFAILPSTSSNTDDQNISLSGDTLYIEDGNNVVLTKYLDNTDSQNLSISGSTLSIGGGNSVTLPTGGGPNNDNDSTNELNTSITFTSNNLTITDAGGAKMVSLASLMDNTDAQTISISNDTLYLSNGGYAVLPVGGAPNLDNDSTNEIQNLSISNDTILISKGNYIKLPAASTGTPDEISDADSDTKIQVEESADEDIIRFDVAGAEKWRMVGDRIEPKTDSLIAIGIETGEINQGTKNLFIGNQAGKSNTTGSNNVYLGSLTGSKATTANFNTYIGNNSGGDTYSASGSGNTGVGYGVLGGIEKGSRNIAIGDAAMASHRNSSWNIAIGSGAMQAGFKGQYNIAIGDGAGLSNQGIRNILIGTSAGRNLDSGVANVFIGNNAGYHISNKSNLLYLQNDTSSIPLIYGEFDNDSLRFNSAVSIRDGFYLPSGAALGRVLTSDANGKATWQTVAGASPNLDNDSTNEIQNLSISNDTILISKGNYIKLPAASTGTPDEISDADSDTKIQVEESADEDIIRFDVAGAEKWRMVGDRLEPGNSNANIFIGQSTGNSTTGPRNVLIGSNSGKNITTGQENVALGTGALGLTTTGSSNTAIGNYALSSNTISRGNTAIGDRTLLNNKTGFSNTAIGNNALVLDSVGQYNVAIGNSSGYFNQGSSNVFIGSNAGYADTIGSNKLYLENSRSMTPLIYGEFDNDSLRFNSAVSIRDGFYLPTGAAAGRVLTSDANGKATWQSVAGASPNLDNDSTNEIQNLSISGNTLSISDGNSITLPAGGGPNNDNDSTNEIQQISLSGNTLTLNKSGGSITLPSTSSTKGIDSVLIAGDNANGQGIDSLGNVGIGTRASSSSLTVKGEVKADSIQVVYNSYHVGGIDAAITAIAGDNSHGKGAYGVAAIQTGDNGAAVYGLGLGTKVNIGVMGEATGGTKNWAGYFREGNFYIQDTLYLNNGAGAGKVLTSDANGKATWQTVGSASPNLDNDSTNEIQNLSITGNTLAISGGNSVTLPTGSTNNDNDSTNELNSAFTLSTNNLTITDASGAKTVDLSSFKDNTDSQSLTLTGNTLAISGGNSVTLPAGSTNNDNDSTNEIQNLSISGNVLTISKGNNVTLPSPATYTTKGIDSVLTAGNNAAGLTLTNLGSLAVNNGISASNIQLTTGAGVNKILTSDASGNASWQTPASITLGDTTQVADLDGDTKIQTEESADEDKIRFDLAGTEKWVMQSSRLEPMNTGSSVFIGENAGNSDDLSNNWNNFIGFDAGRSTTTGWRNNALGYEALESNTTGAANIAIGYRALQASTNRHYNTAVGYESMINSNASGNSSLGAFALRANTSGSYNAAVGYGSLMDNISGGYNSALGLYSLGDNISGYYNVAIGESALRKSINASYNTAIGRYAGYNNLTGTRNIFLGYTAGQNETGSNKLYIEPTNSSTPLIYGDFASDSLRLNGAVSIKDGLHLPSGAANNMILTSDANGYATWKTASAVSLGDTTQVSDLDGDTKIQTEESSDEDIIRFDIGGVERWKMSGARLETNNSGFSVFVGEEAGLNDDLTSNYNAFLGYQAGRTNTSGAYNTAMGDRALRENATGNYNTAQGSNALYSNSTGHLNTATGYYSLRTNVTGGYNSAHGSSALRANSTGNYNTASGYYSLGSNATGSYNVGVGSFTLRYNATGIFNSAVGYGALFYNSTGMRNSGVGAYSLYRNISGDYNAASGYSALYNLRTTDYNSAVGYQAGYTMQTGYNNALIGSQSLYRTTTGYDNSAIGYRAGYYNQAGNQNTYVGSNTGSTANTSYSNSMALGYNTAVSASNQVRVGNSSVTSIGGQVGWTTVSDGRFKENVKNDVVGLSFIMELKPVTYNLNTEALRNKLENKDSVFVSDFEQESMVKKYNFIQSGFVAQDVEKAADKAGYSFSGVDAPKDENDIYGLRYSEFVVPLVKATQEQQELIEKQQKQIENQDALIQQLIDRLEALEGSK